MRSAIHAAGACGGGNLAAGARALSPCYQHGTAPMISAGWAGVTGEGGPLPIELEPRQPSEAGSLLLLGDDVIALCFQFLDVPSLARAEAVCTKWRHVIRSADGQLLWQPHFVSRCFASRPCISTRTFRLGEVARGSQPIRAPSIQEPKEMLRRWETQSAFRWSQHHLQSQTTDNDGRHCRFLQRAVLLPPAPPLSGSHSSSIPSILLFGGSAQDPRALGRSEYYNDAWQVDIVPGQHSIRRVDQYPISQLDAIPAPRTAFSLTVHSDLGALSKLYVFGGHTEGFGFVSDLWLGHLEGKHV